MSKNLLVDYIPFEVSREQINESISDNDGRLIVKGVLQRADSKNQNGRVYPKDTLMREAKKYAGTGIHYLVKECAKEDPKENPKENTPCYILVLQDNPSISCVKG